MKRWLNISLVIEPVDLYATRGTSVFVLYIGEEFNRSELLLRAPYELCKERSTKSTAWKPEAPNANMLKSKPFHSARALKPKVISGMPLPRNVWSALVISPSLLRSAY